MMKKTMVITGGNGNIGQKIAAHLLQGTRSKQGEQRMDNSCAALESAPAVIFDNTPTCATGEVQWHVKLFDDYNGAFSLLLLLFSCCLLVVGNQTLLTVLVLITRDNRLL